MRKAMVGKGQRVVAALAVGLGLAAGLLAPAGRSAAAAEPKEHVWEGKLAVRPGVELRLVLHVTATDAGTNTATFDSPDQGANGLKVDSVTLDKASLTFEMKGIGAKFAGKLNDAGTEAEGSWEQAGASFPLTLQKKDKPAPEPAVMGKEQVWEGKIPIGAGLSFRLVLHVVTTEAGIRVGTLDSPDQGAKGIKVDSVALDKDKLSFEIKSLSAKYEGTLNPEGTEAKGTWEQLGNKLPLTLKKADKPTEVRRPQTPKPPFPYKSEDVSYTNKAGGVTLAGTLTLPEGPGPFPAVVLISGSGAQDRDETIFQHKPFLVLADALTRRGVAVLRVDDRGVGGSTGSIPRSTTEDFAGDVLAGVGFLKSRKDIDGRKIGLVGHSEGGVIAPIAAARSWDVAYIVLLAGTGLPGDAIVKMQARLILKALGMSDESIERRLKVQSEILEIAKTERDPQAAEAKMLAAVDKAKEGFSESEKAELKDMGPMVDAQLKAIRSPWLRFFLAYDPRPALAKMTCPVLAVIGEKDLQVPPKENLEAIEKTLKQAGNPRVTVQEIPGVNHLFQTCKTGSPAEYATIEETIAPAALETVVGWIVEQTKGDGKGR
jgi:pimeloyl-ACP methyl ester carboxylesterase